MDPSAMRHKKPTMQRLVNNKGSTRETKGVSRSPPNSAVEQNAMERRADATQTPIAVGEPNHLYTSKRLRTEILARIAGVAGGASEGRWSSKCRRAMQWSPIPRHRPFRSRNIRCFLSVSHTTCLFSIETTSTQTAILRQGSQR